MATLIPFMTQLIISYDAVNTSQFLGQALSFGISITFTQKNYVQLNYVLCVFFYFHFYFKAVFIFRSL